MAAIVDLAKFRQDMRAIAVRVAKEGAKIQRKVAIQALSSVTMGTPVDTGRARANWNTAIGSPDRTLRDAPGSAGQALNDTISRGSQAVGNVKMGDTIYLSNSLPYIERLNDGHSSQAPAGFVEKSLQQAVDAVNKEKVDI